MKRCVAALIAVSLLAYNLFCQHSYIQAGAGFLPHSYHFPYQCPVCEFPVEYQRWFPTLTWQEIEVNRGYQFSIGFGKEIKFHDHWSVTGDWTIFHMEHPGKVRIDEFDRLEPDAKIHAYSGRRSLQYTSLQMALALRRNFRWKDKDFGLFAGGYTRVKIQDWTREWGTFETYFAAVDFVTVYDSALQTYETYIANKYPLSTPEKGEGDYQYDSKTHPVFMYGLFGGLELPLLSGREGDLSLRIMVARDTRRAYSSADNAFGQTSLNGALLFQPEVDKRLHPRKPQKRMLPGGIYTGVSIHNFFASLNGSWHSSRGFGLDVSARPVFVVKDQAAIYVGPNYRLWHTRFFAKAGLEYFWVPNPEGYDEAFFRFHIGGKYIVPFSNRMGLQVDTGYYSRSLKRLMETHRSFWGMGIGVVFFPD